MNNQQPLNKRLIDVIKQDYDNRVRDKEDVLTTLEEQTNIILKVLVSTQIATLTSALISAPDDMVQEEVDELNGELVKFGKLLAQGVKEYSDIARQQLVDKLSEQVIDLAQATKH